MNTFLDKLDELCEALKSEGHDGLIMELAWKRVLRVPPEITLYDSDHPLHIYGRPSITVQESSARMYTKLNEFIGEYEPVLQTMFHNNTHPLFKKTQSVIIAYREMYCIYVDESVFSA